MADDQQQDDQQDETQGDEQQDGTGKDGTGKDDAARGGDADKPGAALLKALNEERDARRKAESALRKREQAERDAETQRAIKAGEWESVAKAKDTEIADKDARIAELEALIANRDHDLLRAQVAAEFGFDAYETSKLTGQTIEELRADAKELKKRKAPPPAGNTELGKGGDRSGKPTDQELVEQLRKSGRYASVG